MSAPVARILRGAIANQAGRAAETVVKARYETLGATLLAERWRGTAGEIDLIFRHEDVFVFVEVKRAKSLDAAAHRLSAKQLGRITTTAQEYLDCEGFGLGSLMRFDLACVSGPDELEILDNITI